MRHVLDIDTLSTDDINHILKRAKHYDILLQDKGWQGDTLKEKTVLLLFFENSTRTAISFETAARKLGADVTLLNIQASSTQKGESLMDTVRTMDTITQPDIIIIRHKEYGAPNYIAKRISAPVINAGDSWRAHPTQALLDAYTIMQHKGSVKGLTITICGDIAHSRVARSNLILLGKMENRLRLVGPPTPVSYTHLTLPTKRIV